MNHNKLIMTPGPTEIEKNVLEAIAVNGTNPDLDPDFFESYLETVNNYNKLVGAENATTFLLSGEAILGLEAACASFIEDGDKVLCIANGVFGDGFKGFIEMYGGNVLLLELPWHHGVKLEDVEAVVEAHSDIKAVTMVHCETPSGITNNVSAICQYLRSKNIITIVDSVSAVGGETVDFDKSQIDVLLGGSQKCLSSPAGMTIVTLSDHATTYLEDRESNIRGYYLNLKNWMGWYERKWFPYTQPLQNILGLNQSILNLLDKNALEEHKTFAVLSRTALERSGFELFAKTERSNTVTTVKLPADIAFSDLFTRMKDHHCILIGGGIGPLKDHVFRIGHMGANNKPENMVRLFSALEETFNTLGHQCEGLSQNFKI